VALGLSNAFGARAGTLVVHYDDSAARALAAQAFAGLWPMALAALAAGLTLLAAAGRWLAGADDETQAHRNHRITGVLSVMLVALQGLFAWNAYDAVSRLAREDAPRLAGALAQTVQPTLDRALGHGIALQDLQGVQDWLRTTLGAGPEFAGLRLTGPDGRELYRADAMARAPQQQVMEVAQPLVRDGQAVATLHVALNVDALGDRARQMAVEFVMVLLAGALLIHEVLRALPGARAQPPDGAADLQALRLPLFLFFLASELPRAFLPVWSQTLAAQAATPSGAQGGLLATWLQAVPAHWLTPLPVSLFLLSVALVSPFAGALCARHGARRLLALAMGCALAGHAVALAADSWVLLCLARVLAGVSFGAASVAAIDFIGRQQGARATGMAMYLAAYVAAGIAGAGAGAVLADRAGYPAVFALGMVLAVLAGLLVLRLPRQGAGAAATPAPWRALKLLLGHGAFTRLVVLVSLPLQVVQQGLLFFWAPLALASLGEHASFTGLAMMGYFVAVLLCNGPFARRADRDASHARWIAAGLGTAGAAALLAGLGGLTGAVGEGGLAWPGFAAHAVAAGMVLTGLAWAMAFAPQGAVALRISRGGLDGMAPAVAVGVYRTVERVAGVLAPLLVAALVALWGYAVAAAVLGGLLLASALAWTLAWAGLSERMEGS